MNGADNTVATLADSLTIKQALILIADDLQAALAGHTLALAAIVMVGCLAHIILLLIARHAQRKQLAEMQQGINALLVHAMTGQLPTGASPGEAGK